MINLITIDGKLLGKTYYHPGLVYRPSEKILFLATLWASKHVNSGTAKRYLKVLQAFCRHYAIKMESSDGIDSIITNFERYVLKSDIEEWMDYRADVRDAKGCAFPKEKNILEDGKIVARYLRWAKQELKTRGVPIPYCGEKVEKRTFRKSKNKNFFAGVKDSFEKEVINDELNRTGKPVPGVDPKIIALSSQHNGHCYFKPEEMRFFIWSFSEILWTILSLTAYITGLRPHELLAVPRFMPYDNGSYFTADPVELRRLRDQEGAQEIIYRCHGKGKKLREVAFNIHDWITIMDIYEPHYQARRKLYKKKEGKPLESHLLWLVKPTAKKQGKKTVQYCLPGDEFHYDDYLRSLRAAVAYVRNKHNMIERFGHMVDFYALRHTFATNFIINALNVNKDLREKTDRNPLSLLEDFALRKRLTNQLGHDGFETTFQHYIENVAAIGAIKFPSPTDLGMKPSN